MFLLAKSGVKDSEEASASTRRNDRRASPARIEVNRQKKITL